MRKMTTRSRICLLTVLVVLQALLFGLMVGIVTYGWLRARSSR